MLGMQHLTLLVYHPSNVLDGTLAPYVVFPPESWCVLAKLRQEAFPLDSPVRCWTRMDCLVNTPALGSEACMTGE